MAIRLQSAKVWVLKFVAHGLSGVRGSTLMTLMVIGHVVFYPSLDIHMTQSVSSPL